MNTLALLKQTTFGSQVAEDEANALAEYFVETEQWDQIRRGAIDLVRGEKGAGKSAIYSLLISKGDELFGDGILIVGAESPRGASVFKDLLTDPPTTEQEFVVLWKVYILILIARRLRDFDVRGEKASVVFRTLEDAKLLERESGVAGLLNRIQSYTRRLIEWESAEGGLSFDWGTMMPTGVNGRIVLKEPDAEWKARGIYTIDRLFELLDEALADHRFKIWVLFDRLDVAFNEDHELEANALRALIKVYGDVRAFDRIALKVFLREDIWNRIMAMGMREATHLTKSLVLDWSIASLLNLTMRRLLNNRVLVEELDIDRTAVLRDSSKQDEVFRRLFPEQVDKGKQKSQTFNWIVKRCADGTRKTAPREVIMLLNEIRNVEIKRLEQGGGPAEDGKLFDRSVFKLALPAVSKYRLNQYLYAEFPSERKFVNQLAGGKCEHTDDTLAAIWKVDSGFAADIATKLVSIGFFEKRGTREEPNYWVPFLYRDALELVQGRADAEDE